MNCALLIKITIFAACFERDTNIFGSVIPIHHLEQRANLQKERRRIMRRRFNDCRGLW